MKLKFFLLTIFISLASFFLFYLVSPNSDFPPPPPGSLQSSEPADTESPDRRAYFVDMNRQEVISYYQKVFVNVFFMPTLRLNYPPEESQLIIRDQTRSTYLEELVHPFRNSIYINGFEPKVEKDVININGKTWEQKIIVRYVYSNAVWRVVLFLLILVFTILLVREYNNVKKN